MEREIGSNNKNISEIVLNVVLRGLSKFVEFNTEQFYVNGTPWHIEFRKQKDGTKWCLGAYLHSDEAIGNEFLIVAASYLSMTTNQESYGKNIFLHGFTADNPYWGIDSFIEWDQLISPNNGYVTGDSCKFKVKVEATPLLNAAENEWWKFEITSKCESCLQQNFRMTIHQFQVNGIGVCSPKIDFLSSSWRIVVGQFNGKIAVKIVKTGNISCSLSFNIKLLSFDPKIKTIVNEFEEVEFNLEGSFAYYDLIHWNELINPRKKFIQNNSFVIEIAMKAVQANSTSKRRRTFKDDDTTDAVVLMCSACNRNLKGCPIASFSCGHMFCNPCSLKVTECPKCGIKTSLTDLRPVLMN